MQKPLLIFDLDGTLIETRPDLRIAINLLRQFYGLPPVSLETVSSYIGEGVHKLVARSLHEISVNLDEAARIAVYLYRLHIHDESMPYPGVVDGLKKLLRAGYVLAVISNKPTEPTRALLEHFRMAEFFSSIKGGESDLPLKPDPAVIVSTMKTLRVEPARTWLVGDSHIDLEAARRAGIKSAFVSYGIGTSGPEKPSASFSSFHALLDFFLNLGVN